MKGKGVSSGIGFGKALVLKKEKINIPRNKVVNNQKELNLFNKKYNEVIDEIKTKILNLEGTEYEIMSAYIMIMEDKSLIEKTLNLINKENYNMIYATEIGFNEVIETFKNIEDEYMSARAKDIEDIKNIVIKKLLDIKDINLSKLKEKTIIIARELGTSDIARLDLKNIEGIVTEVRRS